MVKNFEKELDKMNQYTIKITEDINNEWEGKMKALKEAKDLAEDRMRKKNK